MSDIFSTLKWSGRVILSTDDDFGSLTHTWNHDARGTPLALVQPQTVQDVSDFFRWYSETKPHFPQGLAVAGGRHSLFCMPTDAVVVDLSLINYAHVDPDKKIVRVGGGAKLRHLDTANAVYGLATPAGHNPDTGIGGLTLSGGIGHLSRLFGLTVDNLIEVTMVDCHGSIIVASDETHPDLMFALRGGGGNFGVVVEFVFRAHPIPQTILAGILVHPLPLASRYLSRAREICNSLPNETTAIFCLTPNVLLSILGHFPIGDLTLSDSNRVLAPFRDEFIPIQDGVQEMKYTDLQQIIEKSQTDGHYYERGCIISEMTDEVISILTTAMEKIVGEVIIGLILLGGEGAKISSNSSFAHRNGKYWILILCKYNGTQEEKARIKEWAQNVSTQIDNLSNASGVYAACIGDTPDQLVRVYGDHLPRLIELKKKYDPENVFRHTRNIPIH
jgi:FAD/FMN-containing dehydrogenase